MAEESSVKLRGMWASPYVTRVKLALKVKGIEFEYVEEDLMNKSKQLLLYNPVHKKVPVLVHCEKSVAESLVILEYLDEAWPESPQLLLEEPYQRSKLRFWARYFQLFDKMRQTLVTEGEAQQSSVNNVMEMLDVAEKGLKQDLYPDGTTPSFKNRHPGYLDIVIYSFLGSYEAVEEMLGVKFLDPERYPLLHSCVEALREVAVVQEVTPPREKLIGFLKFLRQKYLHQPKA